MSGHLTVPLVEAWKPAAFGAQALEFTRQAGELRTAVDGQHRAVDGSRDTFRRETGNAMRARYDEVHQKALIIADALERGRDAATSAESSVGSAQRFLVTKKTEAIGKGLEVRDDGTCVISETTKQRLYSSVAASVGDNNAATIADKYAVGIAALQVEANTHTIAVKSALNGAADADTGAKKAIEAAFANLPTPDSFGNATTSATVTPQPPKGGTPQENRAWWDSLTTAQRDEIASNSPGSIGNLDGLPADVRDTANRAMIPIERARLEADEATLTAVVAAAATTRDSVALSDAQTSLDRTRQKLADLSVVETAVNADSKPPRMLMALDMQSGRQGRAAVSVGNPDTADHIAVTTPGLGSNLESTLLGGGDPKNPKGGMLGEAEQLIATSTRQLEGVDGRSGEEIAAIAWFGYDPPQGGLGSLSDLEADMSNVGFQGRAQEGAQPLASFFTGLDVANETSDPHITALGHSYGSLTTSLALQEQSGVVDDAVFYGSPGLGRNVPDLPNIPHFAPNGGFITELGVNDAVTSAEDLGLRPGHVYEMTERDDPVADLDGFGRSPHQMDWVTHLSTDPITVDGQHYSGASGHSEYGRTDGATNNLHRSGYNLAAIVAGLPENATDPRTVR
ncbi:alpha/beta hydrolase [Nocardia sp. NPDC058176]|uniref:alpha/beta hydrolase n=1 Tax=Nocardia sp. NPDC058176 TaxID=3346368 RepID=UPI0036DC20A1